MRTLAIRAEEIGFDTVWIPDELLWRPADDDVRGCRRPVTARRGSTYGHRPGSMIDTPRLIVAAAGGGLEPATCCLGSPDLVSVVA
jgi:alkanesulfonate monooxygenase SsuD/methylene tetrahydromethanopterin reductase-like flavin-dependent oxidoreductase (luciferase family)